MVLWFHIQLLLIQPAMFCNLNHEKVFRRMLIIWSILTIAPILSDYLYQYFVLQGNLFMLFEIINMNFFFQRVFVIKIRSICNQLKLIQMEQKSSNDLLGSSSSNLSFSFTQRLNHQNLFQDQKAHP